MKTTIAIIAVIIFALTAAYVGRITTPIPMLNSQAASDLCFEHIPKDANTLTYQGITAIFFEANGTTYVMKKCDEAQ